MAITLTELGELKKCDRFMLAATKALRADYGIRPDAYIETIEGDCNKIIKVSLRELIELAYNGPKIYD